MYNIDEFNAKTDAKGPFVMRYTVSWADFFLSAFLKYLKNILGEEWNIGRKSLLGLREDGKNLLHALGDQAIKY